MTLKYRNLSISIGIVAAWVLVNFIAFYPDRQGLGSTFSVSVIYVFTAYGSLTVGVILLILRIIKVWKNRSALLYVLIGVINIAIGLIAVSMYFSHMANREWLNKSLLNLLLGVLIISDVYLAD